MHSSLVREVPPWHPPHPSPGWLSVPDDANALAPPVWPSSAARDDDGELVIGGRDAASLAAEFGTPLYVVDEADARARAARVKRAFEDAVRRHRHDRDGLLRRQGLPLHRGRPLDDRRRPRHRRLQRRRARRRARRGRRPRAPRLPRQQQEPRRDRPRRRASASARSSSTATIEIERVARGRRTARSGAARATARQQRRARLDPRVPRDRARGPEVRHPARRGPASSVRRIRSHASLDFLGLHSHIGSQIFESAGFAEAADRLLAVHAELLADGPGARAQPRRRLRHRLHDRRRARPRSRRSPQDFAARRRRRVRRARHPGADARDRARPRRSSARPA